MKKLFPLLLAVMAVCVIRLQAQTVGIDPFGYGAGVTGGGSATPTLVSNLSELKNALSNKPTNKVIIITKDITVDGVIQVKDGSNLTLMALPGVKIIATNWDVALADGNKLTGIFEFTRIDNLIIRNLTLEGPGAYDCDGRDHITLQDVTNAWIDHCDFSDAVDDCMDIKNTSDNITVSWCHFHYDKAYHPNGPGDASGDKDHRFVSLLGSSSSDKPSDGKYNVTYAYLWFDEGCMQRMIRCRNADLHFLGCYWNSSKASYYIGPENVSAYIELCTFEGGPKAANIYKAYNSTKNPVKFVNTVSANGLPSEYGTVSAPTYSYAKYATAAEAKTAVTDPNCGAGATLIVSEDGTVSSRCSVSRVKYTITFNANGGSGSMDAQEGYEGANTTLNPCTFTAPTGKAFAGWNTASNGSGTAYADQSVIVLTEDTTLYAQWAQAYTVTYNNNGHGTTPDAVTVGSGAVLMEPVAPSESGWVFGGWYLEPTCVNAWDFATMTVTKDLTLYAKWTEAVASPDICWSWSTAETISTTTSRDGLTIVANSTGTITIDASEKTIDGRDFTHRLKLGGSGNASYRHLYFAVTGSCAIDIYAQSSSTSADRSLTVHSGSFTGTKIGTALAPGAAPAKSTITYTGGAGNIYVYSPSSGVNIYGICVRYGATTEHTITYELNGHGDAIPSESGTALPTPLPTPSEVSGWIFEGWYTNADLSLAAVAGASIDADITLYAKWTEQTSSVGYTISYNMNGHGSALSSVSNATTLPNPLPTPSASGYVFGGWYTDAGLSSAAVAGASIDADITLYAKWTATSSGGTSSGYEWYVDSDTHKGNNDFYTVSGNYSNSKGKVTYNGTTYEECLKMETETRITFTLTEKVTMTFVFDPSGKFKIDGTEYTTDANGIYTIELTAGGHTITKGDAINLFYINAVGSAPAAYTATIGVTPAAYGSVDVSSIADIASGTAIAISGNTLTIGSTSVTATPATATAEYTYSFDSWTINPDGATVTSDITITANFTRTANTYTLTWDANGGVLTGKYTHGTVAYGTAIVQPAAPTREGHTFLGWDVTPAATMPAANTTYTAQWEAVVITETTFHTAGKWSVASNWTNGLPSASLIANIEANCLVDISTAVAKQVRLKSGNTLTVAPTGGLQIAEDIKRQDGTTLQAGDLTIQSNSTNQGAIVIGTEDGTTPATVEFYSKAYKDAHTHYQYIGIPFSNAPLATAFFTGSIVYTYAESSGWVKATTSTTLQAFTGYCLSQTAAKTYTMQGQLCASATKSIPLTYSAQNGANLVGNSWMAPLQINNFEDADFPVGAEKTIFIYNTGSVDEYNSNNDSSSFGSKPGQYFSIPIHAAPYADGLPTAIPPMQAFQVNTTQNGNLTLDYARLTGSATGLSTDPLRAPQQHQAEQEAPVVLRIAVSGNEGTTSSDQVYLMQRADFTEDFDNGWDGTKMQGDANLLSLYTADNKAIDARPNMIGTQLIFRAGEEQEYTLAYEYNGSEAIYLYDAKTNRYSPISDGCTYAFSSTAAEVSARFRIASAEEALQTPTGVEQICMQDGNLYNPFGQEMHIRLFDARGCLIMQTTTTEAIYRVEGYGKGIYIMEVTTNTQRQLQKLILSDK